MSLVTKCLSLDRLAPNGKSFSKVMPVIEEMVGLPRLHFHIFYRVFRLIGGVFSSKNVCKLTCY